MDEPKTVRAVVYARQSVQLDHGIDAQVKRCVALIESREGWTHTGTYSDNSVSAAKSRGKSTGWARMLADQEADKFDVVVAVDLDRLLRSIRDLLTLTERNMKIVTVSGDLDLTREEDEFRATMLAAIARFEVRRKGARQTRANKTRAAKGIPLPGRRRYGYLGADKDAGRVANTVKHPDESKVIEEIFERFVSGETVYGIATDLNKRGIVPTTGKAKAWRPIRIRETLRNKCYAGFAVHRGDYVESAGTDKIVTLKTFKDAEAILSDPSRTTSPGPTRKHWLSGLGTCEMCGALLKTMNGGYLCSVASSHVWITKATAEDVIAYNLAAAIQHGAELEGGDRAAMLATIAELHEIEADVRYADEDRRAKRITRQEEVRRTNLLSERREEATRRLEELRASAASAEIFANVVNAFQVNDAGLFELTPDIEGERARIMQEIFDLPLDRRRELCAALVDFSVAKGRALDRVKVVHKVATELNGGLTVLVFNPPADATPDGWDWMSEPVEPRGKPVDTIRGTADEFTAMMSERFGVEVETTPPPRLHRHVSGYIDAAIHDEEERLRAELAELEVMYRELGG